jgi:Arc/MetJ-type ribon-helix-helix transcriptional regulator
MATPNLSANNETPKTAILSAPDYVGFLDINRVQPTESPVNSFLAANPSFPPELTSRKQWLCWRLWYEPGNPKLKKQPFNPTTGGHASCDDPTTWSDYATCLQAVRDGKYEGLGIVLTKETGLVILDLENCVSNGQIHPWALREVEALDSFTEISASGTGVHVLCWGSIPSGRNRQKLSAELWDSSKMFCLTGIIAEGQATIQKRDLIPIHNRISFAEFGPAYRPTFVVEKYDSQKFRDICDDKWRGYFGSRSDAIQSALWTLAQKHDSDPEAMREEFEATSLCDAWGPKWARRGDEEIKRAIEGVAGLQDKAAAMRRDLSFRLPKVPGKIRDYVMLAKPGCLYNGWFPRGRVHIVAGSSGAGKTTLTVDLLEKQQRGESFLGHEGARLPFLLLFADRGDLSNQETLERMGLLNANLPMDHLPVCWGIDAASAILNKIEDRATLPAVVFVEGADILVENASKTEVVAPFLGHLQKIAAHYHIALILSVGAPKSKPREQHTLKRDRVFGSQIWPRMSEDILTLSQIGDGTSAQRELDVQHRNAATEKFSLEFCNGLLVEAVARAESDPLAMWAASRDGEGWFLRADAVAGMAEAGTDLKKSAVYGRLKKMAEAGRIEASWRDGKEYLRWKARTSTEVGL